MMLQQQLQAPASLGSQKVGAARSTESTTTTPRLGAMSALEMELRDAKAQIVRQDAELATLRLKLSRAAMNEGVPPTY